MHHQMVLDGSYTRHVYHRSPTLHPRVITALLQYKFQHKGPKFNDLTVNLCLE